MVTTPAHVAKASRGEAAELVLGRHYTRAKAQYDKMVKLAKSQVVVDVSDGPPCPRSRRKQVNLGK